ncbi:glycosyltransferase family 2 protein [Acanthopleuribacter pedis]|uniref:Glycosyltransferase family 2 protein n=1 Tax=Acanthopleuribacter pedis TaxID=442870 RepID=A0A8J7U3P9_9BACT|nr:glycosyltransferase family 2 protein [Acanthopleuribacter pedis]MBO1320658.1 glycosyltransferase family 2 protein [Acanthopleuribacter pedis]
MKACILIPIYNNKDTIEAVVAEVRAFSLPIVIVNDGSDAMTHTVLDAISGEDVEVVHLAQNGGKGMAVKTGLVHAHRKGFTHALQIDADGQHRAQDIPKFLTAAEAEPEALVLGCPVFSDDVPAARLHGRKLSVWLVWLQTMSRAIRDPLFGFRVYPLQAAVGVIDRYLIGNRMDFDPEIAVKLYWVGCPVVNIHSPVRYPEGGLSSFRMVRDNIRITLMHTRLVLGMIPRLPRLLGRKKPVS